jgi:hypothetical protein
MAAQIAGNTIGNLLEIEAATHAARVTLRPEDYGALGIYSVANTNGATQMTAGIAAGSTIFSFRWGNTPNLALVKRVRLSAGNGATAFTAGNSTFLLQAARSFTASDSLGQSLVPSGNQNKLRTSGMGTSLLTDARIANTVALTPGTRSLDTNPIAAVVAAIPNVAGSPILAPYNMWEAKPGEHPLLLAQNEGFIITTIMPATGTWFFSVGVDWVEIAAY